MKKRYISFMNQILIFCSLIVVLPFTIIIFFYTLETLKKADKDYQDILKKANIQVETGVSAIISNAERLSYLHIVNDSFSELLRHKHDVYDWDFLKDNKVVVNIVRDAVLLNPDIYNVVIINSAGNVYDSNFNYYYWKNMYQDLPMWGEMAKNSPEKRFIDIRYSSENVPEALMLVKPMEDIERGKTLGIIGITISFKAIREILTNIVLDGEQLIVYNKSGVPVYSCSGKNVEKQEDSQGKIWKCLNIAEMEEDSAVKTFAIGKDTYIGGIQKLNQLGWTVVTYTDRSYVRKPYTQNIRVFFIIAVLITVFDLGLAYLFIRRLNFSIHGLCQAMEKSGENGIPETLFLEKREFKTEIDMLIHSYNNVICRLKKSMEQSVELQMNEQRMEFRMLQAQINPHFLYNTFNLISSIAGMNGIDSICKITVSISEMFRYSIQENLIVQLQDELREINNYVTIQTIRFKDRLYADFDVEEEVLKVPIPIFLLQPLVENAIIHGLEPKAESGYINIVAYMEDDFVEILIRDNGVGIPQDKLCQIIQSLEKEQIESISMQGHSSIGIKNVNQRIKAYYGAEYGLHLESRVNVGTTISIRLPKNLTKKIRIEYKKITYMTNNKGHIFLKKEIDLWRRFLGTAAIGLVYGGGSAEPPL